MKVATHNGNFHADEVFALATLKLAGVAHEFIRTRDVQILQTCDLRVDVGHKYNPDSGDFDHHQSGGAGQRTNGIPYASFGLIWREYGPKLCGSNEAAAIVDEKLVQTVDAHDNGISVYDPLTKSMIVSAVDRSISMFNPTWEESQSDENYSKQFYLAIDIAQLFLKREIAVANSKLKAVKFVRQAIKESTGGKLIIFEKYMPWKEVVIKETLEAKFVIYPRLDGTWALQAIPRKIDGYDNRLELPRSWAGKSDEELIEITGIANALFCHRGRFIATAKNKEGVLELAKLALGQSS